MAGTVQKNRPVSLLDAVATLATALGGGTAQKLITATRSYVQARKTIYEKYHQQEILAAQKFQQRLQKMKDAAVKENKLKQTEVQGLDDLIHSL